MVRCAGGRFTLFQFLLCALLSSAHSQPLWDGSFTTTAFRGFAATDANGEPSERSSTVASRLRFCLLAVLTIGFCLTAVVAKIVSGIRKLSLPSIWLQKCFNTVYLYFIQSTRYVCFFPPGGTATLSTLVFFHTKLGLLWKREMIERSALVPKIYTCRKTNGLNSSPDFLFTVFPPTSAPSSKSSPLHSEWPREEKWIHLQGWGVPQFIKDAKGRKVQLCFSL